VCAARSSDGDGDALLAIGAPADEGTGSAWLFPSFGQAGVRARMVGSVLFGFSLDVLRDCDGDHIPEVLVGAPGQVTGLGRPGEDADPSERRAGEVFLLSGSSGARLGFFPDPYPGSAFGACVQVLEDVNGEDREGFVVGCPLHESSTEDDGTVLVFSAPGSAPLHDRSEQISVLSVDCYRDREDSRYGYSLAGVGDMDGDGFDDLLIGAPEGFWCGGLVGWAEVVSGRSGESIRFLAPDWEDEQAEGPCPFDPWTFGRSVDALGDIDRDGVCDLIVGAPDLPSGCCGAVQIASGTTGMTIKQIWGATLAEQPENRHSREGSTPEAK